MEVLAGSKQGNQADPVCQARGKLQSSSTRKWYALSPRGEWNIRTDLECQLKFPQEITITFLWSDITLWSTSTSTVIMAELTIPWEEWMEASFERKKKKYTVLLLYLCAYKQGGWHSPIQWLWRLHWNMYPVVSEVFCDYRWQAEKGSQRLDGWGRTSGLLALASMRGQGAGKARILGLTAGSSKETSLPLLHHLEMF